MPALGRPVGREDVPVERPDDRVQIGARHDDAVADQRDNPRKMILEGPRPRHSSSSQVSETRSLPKLWFFSLPTTRKPAAWYRRRAARSSLWVHSMILR